MAIGDIINGIGAATGIFYYFTPAVGVEIMITAVLGDGTSVYGGLSNGVVNSYTKVSDSAEFGAANSKIGINNTNYLVYYSGSVTPPSYTGIQIK